MTESTVDGPRITAVWTDFGGVITPPTDVTLASFCQRVGIQPEQLTRSMRAVGESYGTDSMAPLDTPLVTEQEWAVQVERVLAEKEGVRADLSNFGDKWFTDRATNSVWVDWLRAVRADGVFVGMLSNMVPNWDRHWRAMVPPGELFDDLVLSYEVGCRKPEARIFELAARRAGVRPEHCVLVDDLAHNCDGARAAGWHAVRFLDGETAIGQLRPLVEVKAPR